MTTVDQQAAHSTLCTVPSTATEAMLRPFYECPPEELPMAWATALAVARAQANAAQPQGTHRRLAIPSAWGHEAAVDFTAFATPDDGTRPEEVRGRATVTFNSGGFELRLTAKPTELAQLASLLLSVSAEQESLNRTPQAVPA